MKNSQTMKNVTRLLVAILPFVMIHDYRLLQGIPGVPSFLLIEIFSLFLYFHWFNEIRKENAALANYEDWAPTIRFLTLYLILTLSLSIFNYLSNGDTYVMVRAKELIAALSSFYCIVFFVKTEDQMLKFFNTSMISLTLLLLLAGVQWIYGWPHFDVEGDTALAKLDYDGLILEGNQVLGYFNHPNGIALLILPFVPLTLSVSLFKEWKPGYRLIFFGLFLFCITILYLSRAKGVIAWFLFSMFWVLIVVYIYRNFSALKLLISVAVYCGVVLFSTLYLADNELFAGAVTIYGRLEQWSAVYQLLIDHPGVLIIGGGTHYMIYYSSFFSGGGYEYQNAHNFLINQILLYGFLGFVLLSLFIANISKRIVFNFKVMPKISSIGFGSIIGAFSLLGASFFEPLIEGGSLQSVLFGFLGISIVCFNIIKLQISQSAFIS